MDEVKRIRDEAANLTEESFVVPSSDQQGRSAIITCNCQPFIHREIEEMLYSHRFPFMTKGDLFRWCIFWGMRRLEEYKPSKTGFIQFAIMEGKKYRDELYMAQFVASGGDMEAVVEMYLREGRDTGKAKAYVVVKEAYEDAMKIKQPYWRKKRREEIRQKYGHILNSPPPKIARVSMDPENFEDDDESEGGEENGGEGEGGQG